MGFSAKQVKALRRSPDHRHIRTREAHGRELTYLEGWYAISEANRIFGFDGWSRETIEARCVLARESKGTFIAVYIARVRLTVRAEGLTIIREGHGTADGRGMSPGEVHDIALKAAETDATKRALATFGRPFGLELYKGGSISRNCSKGMGRAAKPLPASPLPVSPGSMAIVPTGADTRVGFHPDDTTPIPRPSRYYGRRDNQLAQHFRNDRRQSVRALGTRVVLPPSQAPSSPPSTAPSFVPGVEPPLLPDRIDKNQLAFSEPKRLRDKNHLKFIASQPCLICGRQPCDPHHLRFAQPRAIGLKVSDEFTVPLCRGHHRELHQTDNEIAWWEKLKIKPLETAKALWEETHPASADISLQPTAPKTASPDQESIRQTVDQHNELANDGSLKDAAKAFDAN